MEQKQIKKTIDEILGNASIQVPKVAKIFKSDICRDWLSEMGNLNYY